MRDDVGDGRSADHGCSYTAQMHPQDGHSLGLSRSVRLLAGFAVEQSNPDYFYGLLGRDSVAALSRHFILRDAVVLDVGAGPRQMGESFVAAGALYVGIDHNFDALEPMASRRSAALVATGERLPVRSGSVDIAFSSNVFEHVRAPERLGDELTRVVRPGGLVVVSYTNWFSPWGGHETSPFHYLGGERAIARYTRRTGAVPKNLLGESLFRTSISQGLAWARNCPDAELIDVRPRYYPWWARRIVDLHGLREAVTWNLWMVLRRR